jgi:hypothetical protein
MRFVLAIALAIVVAACALEQGSSDRAVLNGGLRSAQAARDADAIMQGVQRAQLDGERVARDTNGNASEPGARALTR